MAIKDTARFGCFYDGGSFSGTTAALQRVQAWEARYNGRMDVINNFRKAGYGSISGSSGHIDTAITSMQLTGIQGRMHCMSWEWAAGDTLRTTPYRPVDVITGMHDDYITDMATALSQQDFTVYIRLDHEMNSNWYGWALDPSCYVDHWQHIHGLFQAAGATNVKWFWCTNGGDVPSAWNKQESYYPGHEYVDVVGFDQYNAYSGWHSFDTLIATPYARMRALAPSKKIWIGETGCPEGSSSIGGWVSGGSQTKAAWYTEMFNTTGYDEIEMILMFDTQGGFNWRLDTSTQARDSFKANFEAATLRTAPPAVI